MTAAHQISAAAVQLAASLASVAAAMTINGFGPVFMISANGERIAVAATDTASMIAAASAAIWETGSGMMPLEFTPATTKKPTTNQGTNGAARLPPVISSDEGNRSAITPSTGASSATRANLTIVAVSPAAGE